MSKLLEAVALGILFVMSFWHWEYLAIAAILVLWKISNIYEGHR
jgi:hypothetical protein